MEQERTSIPLRIVGGRLLEARRSTMEAHAPHRLEPVATIDEVIYINDSKATFLDATLETLAQMDRHTVWIVGAWSDDMAEGHVQDLLKDRVAAVVLFGPIGDVQFGPDARFFHAEELRTAVFLARELAKPGDAVLFSPACPSGNGFANYEERGTEFKRAVRDL